MSIDVFLGVQDSPPDPPPPRRPYGQWYHPKNLEQVFVPEECESRLSEFASAKADYWDEYYRPSMFTSLGKHFAFSMNSSSQLNAYAHSFERILNATEVNKCFRFLFFSSKAGKDFDESPFIPRVSHSAHPPR